MPDEVCPACGRRKPGRRSDPVEGRLFRQVDKKGTLPTNGTKGRCWQWTGPIHPINKYGSIWKDGRYQRVHRVSWELLVGPLTPGLTVDRKCENKQCVNPKHLEEVTTGENTRRYHERKRR